MRKTDLLTPVSRRAFFRLTCGGTAAFTASSWLGTLAAHAAETRRKYKSCILLWMAGGPTQFETFAPTPEAPEEYRGKFKAIRTAVPGIQISELFPRFAEQMKHAAIIRSMSTEANAHESGRYLMHTGYPQTEPKVDGKPFPDMGAVVSKEFGDPAALAPNYVYLANEGGGTVEPLGPGFLGTAYRALVIQDPDKGVENLKSDLNPERLGRRTELLGFLHDQFARERPAEAIEAHRTNIRRASGLMQSTLARAFDISLEPKGAVDSYGGSRFGKQCLMARRLVEVGVPFVEISSGNWDHHSILSTSMARKGPETDAGMAALVADLHSRGLLDSTLVVWMGEFGRTPKNNRGGDGRDHYSKAWSTVLIGGGTKGGQVIGRTDKLGETVEDRPVSAADFFATIFKLLGIDPKKEHQASGGRPIRIVREGAKPIVELIG
jgi:uncharacterized protein (DUF1501 family)